MTDFAVVLVVLAPVVLECLADIVVLVLAAMTDSIDFAELKTVVAD